MHSLQAMISQLSERCHGHSGENMPILTPLEDGTHFRAHPLTESSGDHCGWADVGTRNDSTERFGAQSVGLGTEWSGKVWQRGRSRLTRIWPEDRRSWCETSDCWLTGLLKLASDIRLL
jgi:hypothetical protein